MKAEVKKTEKKASGSGGRIKKAYKRKRIAIIAAITLIYLVIVAAAAVIIDDRHIEITLLGDEDQLAEAGENYVDPGAEAYFTGNLFGRTKRPVEVRTESGVDTTKLGDYVVKYSAEAFGRSAESYRRVHVRDTKPRGSAHPRFPNFIYKVDYGYLKDTASMDGAGIDVWVGSGEKKIDAIMCIVDLMKRDSEIKILVGCTEEEKLEVYKTHNETQYMKGVLIRR